MIKEVESRSESRGLSTTGIRHIAKLARIKISEKEEKSLKKDLFSILEYIEKLNEVDTTGVEPLYQTTGLVDSFRSDEPRGEFKLAPHQSRPLSDWRSLGGGVLKPPHRISVAEKIGAGMDDLLIGQAPHSQNRFVKVKGVFERKK